jgi:hypothetical protein
MIKEITMKNNKLDYENNNGAACVSTTAPSENNYHQQNNNNFHNNKENILSPDEKFLVPDVPLFSFYKAPIKGTTHPELDVSISDVVCKLKGDEYKSLIERCRSNGKSTLSMIKEKMLDFVTFSGSFSYRNADSITNYSGYICIDLDKLGDPEDTKPLLSQDTSVPPLLIFTSPSGKGIKVVYKVAGDQSDHSHYFYALCNYLRDTYNLKADSSGKDVPRACFLSHDPDLYFNDDYLNIVPLGADFISEYFSVPDSSQVSLSVPSTITEVTDSDVEKMLKFAVNIFERSQDGHKHDILFKASQILGGCFEGGIIEKEIAIKALREAVDKKPNIESYQSAYRTIDDGFEAGRKKPIYDFNQWLSYDKDDSEIISRIATENSANLSSDDEQDNIEFAPGSLAIYSEIVSGIKWVWEGWLPKGFITMLAAQSGNYKSFLAIQIAAAFISEIELPDKSDHSDKGKVLW